MLRNIILLIMLLPAIASALDSWDVETYRREMRGLTNVELAGRVTLHGLGAFAQCSVGAAITAGAVVTNAIPGSSIVPGIWGGYWELDEYNSAYMGTGTILAFIADIPITIYDALDGRVNDPERDQYENYSKKFELVRASLYLDYLYAQDWIGEKSDCRESIVRGEIAKSELYGRWSPEARVFFDKAMDNLAETLPAY